MEKNVETRIQAYLNKLFAGVGQSQELFELKEELMTNMKEKISDYQSQGMDENEAFKETVISMGDLGGLVEDMRKVGQDHAKKAVYTTMTARISVAGIIASTLLILFGALTILMLHFMGLPNEAVFGPGIFIVGGGALFAYSLLSRETSKKYGMTKIRAIQYAIAVGLILFSIFVGIVSGSATGKMFIAISSSMIFLLIGVGIFLGLLFTGKDRRKIQM